MKKILLAIGFFIALSTEAQVVNKFRDSSVFFKGVRFDSTLVFKGLKSGSTADTNVVVISSTGKASKVSKSEFLGDLPIYSISDSNTVINYDVLNSQNAPPGSPATGDTYLVGTSPSGAWVGHAKDIAEWNGSAWVFTDGVQGDFLYNATNALTYIFRSGNWVQTTGIPALNNGNTISSGLRIGTNNSRSLTFETNNVNRGRFDSVGRFYVYDTSLRKANKYLQIDSITGRLVASEVSGSGGGGGDLATLIDDCQNVDAETIDGFETFPILKNDTVYQLSLGTFAELIGGGGGGISDAPSDGQLYGRQNNDWSVFPDAELPSTDHYEFFADTLCEGICSEYVGIKRKGSYSSYLTDFSFVSNYNSLSNKGYVSMGAANSSVMVDDNDDVQINAQGKLRLLTPNYNTSSNGSVLTLIDSMNGECEWKPQYAIKDSTGGGADSQSLHLAFSDSIELSITRGNSIKFAYAIDSVSLITDSLIVFKGGVRKSYVKNTVSFAKNTSKDSIILTLNGIRYAVKDSIGSGGGGSGWSLTGNSGTDESVNFIGTTDTKPLLLRTNNNNVAKIDTEGNIGIGTLVPISTLHVSATKYGNFSNVLTLSPKLSNLKFNTAFNMVDSSIYIGLNSYFNTAGSWLASQAVASYIRASDNGLSFSVSSGNTINGAYTNSVATKSINLFASGNTTIGSISDLGQKLNVVNSVDGIGGIIVSNSNSGVSAKSGIMLYNGNANITSLIYKAGSSFATVADRNATVIENTEIEGIKLHTISSGSTIRLFQYNTERLRIDANGSVGINTATSNDVSAILQANSTTKGFAPPRMTTAQRDAISAPLEGLIIYNLTTHKLNVFTTVWEQITSL